MGQGSTLEGDVFVTRLHRGRHAASAGLSHKSVADGKWLWLSGNAGMY